MTPDNTSPEKAPEQLNLPLNDFQQRIVNALTERKVSGKCPICETNNWSMAASMVGVPLSDPNFQIPQNPPFVPAAASVCNHCGFIKLNAVLALGIDPRKEITGKTPAYDRK